MTKFERERVSGFGMSPRIDELRVDDRFEESLPEIVAAAGDEARANVASAATIYDRMLREEVEKAARNNPWNVRRPNSM